MRAPRWLRVLLQRPQPKPVRRPLDYRTRPHRKLYALHPGYVRSIKDGDLHFIGPGALSRLYGVPMYECIIWRGPENGTLDPEGYVHLYPREDGDYRLP